MHDILRYLSVGSRTVGVLLAMLLGLSAAAQGVLNTAPGVTLASETRSVVFAGGVPGPLLKLSFGFSTDEIVRPGVIPDSFTITLQDSAASQSLVLVNMDAAGTVWAPVTPGTVLLPPENIDHAPIPYSSLTPVLANRTAYEIELTLPARFQGHPLTLYYDLFSNDNGDASQAWFSDAVVVPEPGVWTLLLLGGLGIGWRSRRAVGTRRLGTSLLVVLALCFWMGAGGSARAAEKSFRINDTDLILAEVTPDADVYFRSMRLNRALNVWNVEMVVSNKSARVLAGPIVLLVDSVQGTSGLVGPDGLDDSQPAKAFLDLSSAAGNGSLSPGEVTAARTLTLGRSAAGSPALFTRLFAARPPTVATLAVTRSLDDVGRPLPGVALTGAGPDGAVDQRSDLPSGVASFGRGAGEHQIRFSRDGYLPVWRRETLLADQTTVVPNPRLTPRSTNAFSLTPLGGTVISNSGGGILIQVPPGAVLEPVTATLTALSGQNLPSFLPRGWSPLSAFWLETSGPLQKPLPGSFKPSGTISSGETAALVRWDEGTLEWTVVATLSGRGSNAVSAEIKTAGAYALVAGDLGALAPPTPASGQPLVGSAVVSPEVGGLSATGTVAPSISPASVVPEQVTGIAHIILRHASSPLPSGTLLRGEVTETYHLRDGGLRLSPQYEEFIVGYQRPGDGDPLTLDAEFPMRPLLLFGPDQLSEATVRIDVLTEQPFDGHVLDSTGGQISAGNVRLVAGSGRLTAPSALRLRRLDATAFTNLVSGSDSVVAAFDLTVDSSTLAGSLAAQLGGLTPGGRFVLARILSDTGYYGLQPVERLQSDAAGGLKSLEPASGERLPGLRGSGQYVLVSVSQPQGVVSGVARNGAGVAKAGMPVSLAGLPWLALTDTEGRYQLVAPSGTRDLTVRDPSTGDAGIASITVADPGTGLTQNVDTAPHGPRVARITPAAGTVRVPRVVSVVVEFDEAVNPGSVVGAIQLLKPDDSVVSTSLTLNLGNRIATLSPANELDANTVYRVRLAATIRDPGGLPLEGAREFHFTTVPLSTRDPAAQLIIYQPGATNVPAAVLAGIPAYTPGEDPSAIVVQGTLGVADPEVPVILVNESTGETSTVLSKPDGSFNSVISGAEADFVSATFVNLNGTRVYIPVSRQIFDNGFVGLYPQGGILEAQSDGGPVQVLIKPESIPNRTKFRLKTMSTAQLRKELDGAEPQLATLAGGGMHIEMQGQPPNQPMEVRFPVDLAKLGYPATSSPTNVAAAVAIVRDTQGVKTFEVADRLLFEPSVAAVQRRSGIRPTENEDFAGVLYTSSFFIPGLAGLTTAVVFDYIVVPLLLGSDPVVVKGKVFHNELDPAYLLTGVYDDYSNAKPLAGAFIIMRDTPIGRPGRLERGMVYATSGSDGTFLMVALAANGQYKLIATHPLYNEKPSEELQPAYEIKFSGIVSKKFLFHDLQAEMAPLRVNVAHSPQYPAPGQDCEVQVSAYQGVGFVPEVMVRILSVTNLTGDVPAQLSDVVLTNEHVANNGSSTLWKGTLQTAKSVQVVLRVQAEGKRLSYPINFSGFPPPPTNYTIPPPDTNDVHGPLVVTTDPPERGILGLSGAVNIVFDKPIDRYVEDHIQGIVLDGASAVPKPIVRLGASQQSLSVEYAGLEPDQEYTLTLSGQSIRDLGGKPLDQRPSTSAADSFHLTFKTSPIRASVLPGLSNAKGSAIRGTTLYVIDQGSAESVLIAYDITDPRNPSPRSRTHLFGAPRDLLVIPQYAYKYNPRAPAETNDLVVVVGGDLDTVIDSLGNVSGRGQYLWVINMADPSVPKILASPVVSYRMGSAVTKVRWSPPHLIYQEFGTDIQQIALVNLQELLYGYGSTGNEQKLFENGRPGRDLNGDGDYVDPGELVPIPPFEPLEFYGKQFSYVLQHTTQKILDYSFLAGGDLGGITLTPGQRVDDNGNRLGGIRAAYRTIASTLDISDPTDSALFFDAGAYPRWVTIFDSLVIESNGVPLFPRLALVSLIPDSDGVQKLGVIDITLPRQPRMLNKIPLPESLLGGAMQTVRLRSDGFLQVAGTANLVLLNPRFLAAINAHGDQLHPAIVGTVPSAGGTTRSLGSTGYGYYAPADGSRGLLVQTPPVMTFVNFPGQGSVVDPSHLPSDLQGLTDLVLTMREVSAVPPARVHAGLNLPSDLSPPRPASHFHVLVEAPGTAGRTIELGLESLNFAGQPLSNLGNGFAPVRAVSEPTQVALGQKPRPNCGAPIRSLTAWRMSEDPNSPFYNRYLSRPFALVSNERITVEELNDLKGKLDREILWSGSKLRAFIDPKEAGNPSVGVFAARIEADRKRLQPIASVAALTLHQSYVMGDNPPPPGGTTPLPGTAGAVSAHNGEVRIDATDLSLPSPRMPIEIHRYIGNQDTYEGPFGVGWDFNYAQRVTELDPQMFPVGLQMPVVLRASKEESEIAGSQDVLFNAGMGGVILFQWVATNMPPKYAQDPLVAEFDYETRVSDYYLPAERQGVFDLLVKFKDGRFERLTPDGMRYRYAPGGRLETILGTFPKNRHDLEYDSNGWLIRIDDRSVSGDRFVQFGYYRRGTDPDFSPGLDEVTANGFVEGKVCRLRDYAGRDVLFFYSEDGFLIRREGFKVDGENGGFAGRTQTHYVYQDCKIVGVKSGAEGAPLFSAESTSGPSGKPVTVGGNGIVGAVKLDVPVGNSAATLAGQKSSSTQSDGRVTEIVTDTYGQPTSIKVKGGTGGGESELKPRYNKEGQLVFMQYPEGRIEERTYDTNNPVFRARGNLLKLAVIPGPRGGEGYSQSFNYDLRYNLPAGAQTDANGFSHVITLRPDGREVASILHGDSGTESFSFNDNGQMTSHRDVRGVETSVVYDDATGFPTISKAGDNQTLSSYGGDLASRLGRAATLTPPEGLPTRIKYDANLRMVEMRRGALVSRSGFDERGHQILSEEDLGDGTVNRTRMRYDAKGFLTNSVAEGVEVGGVAASLSFVYTPDEQSRVKSIIHPGNIVQTFDYDNRGSTIRETVGDYVEEYERDREGNVLSVKRGGEVVMASTYDGLNRPVTVTRKTGTADQTESDTYFPGGQVKTHTVSDTRFGTVSQVTTEEIDAMGRTRKLTVNGNLVSPTHQYQYDALEQTDTGLRKVTRNAWDKAGYLRMASDQVETSVFHPDGSGRVTEVEHREDGATYKGFYTYDGLDHRESAGDLLGPMLSYQIRADGRDVAITNARNNVLTMEYSVTGELVRQRRADGMEVRFQHDAQRHVSYSGDASAGFQFQYDGEFRLTHRTLRNGGERIYGDFDARRMPRKITLPGGEEILQYDLQQRLVGRTVNYQGTTYRSTVAYDAADRIRAETFQQGTGEENSREYDFDPSGVMVRSVYHEGGHDLEIRYGYYPDATRRSVRYPSGITVTEDRDASGRLTGISEGGEAILRALSWQGTSQPKEIELGPSIRQQNQYDLRGRLTASRVVRTGDGGVLTHLRYQYDPENNLEIRQYLHRGGKADSHTYDAADRLGEARMGTLPTTASGFTEPLYGRTYSYDPNGLDFLTGVVTTNLGLSLPAFAATWSGHDGFLQPTQVDGFDRGPADPQGNVQNALLQVRERGAEGSTPLSAVLSHNGNGNLVRILREDGVEIENSFEPGGLRIERKISRGGSVAEVRHYVYDDEARLLEEYETSGGSPILVARYFYGDNDVPRAADLLDEASGQLRRYYYSVDGAGSVVAVLDEAGRAVERIWYDPFGQPVIEAEDVVAPTLRGVVAGDGGSLLIELSEPVSAPIRDPGEGSGIVGFAPLVADDVVRVSVNSGAIKGTAELLPSFPDHAPYSVIRFTPGQPLPSPPTALTGWWPADSAVRDVSGGHDGALRGGATVGPGLIQQSFVLDGVGAFVEIPSAPALNVGTGDFTLLAWVNFNGVAGDQVLVEKWNPSTRAGWSLVKRADNRIRLALGTGTGSELDVDTEILALPTGKWIQFAARRRGNVFDILTNGVPVRSGSFSGSLDSSASLKFGSRDGAGAFLRGKIDEVTLYSRALTEGELVSVAGGVSVPGPVTVTLNPGALADEWGNTNGLAEVSFQAGAGAGTVYYEAIPNPDTAARRLARSSVGSPILFHGQYFDYDTGLIYLRARFYDPYAGMFLEPDPAGYADSVNHYAGMGNNPVNNRDPSGLMDWIALSAQSQLGGGGGGIPTAPPSAGRGGLAPPSAVDLGVARYQPPPFVDPVPPHAFKTSAEARAARNAEVGLEKVQYHNGIPIPNKLGHGGEKSWLELDLYAAENGGAAEWRAYALAKLENYRGHRRLMIGLEDYVRATAERWGGIHLMSSAGKATDFKFADRFVNLAYKQARARGLRAGLRPRIIVNVEGWAGATLEEKVSSSILRGAYTHFLEGKFTAAELTEFKQTFFPRAQYLEVFKDGQRIRGITDLEMFRGFTSGALEQAIFVSGTEGQVVLRNSAMRSFFRRSASAALRFLRL